MSYLDTVNEKKQVHAQVSKEQQELATMVRQMQQIQAAALATNNKPTVILTDQTDLGDKIKSMVDTFAEAVKSTDTSMLDKEQISALNELKKGVESLKNAVEAKKTDNSDIVKAIKALDLNVAAPIVNVPAPQVTLQERPIDFTPLQDTIKEYFRPPDVEAEDEKIDLECYRAQDITDKEDVQYIGFVNPDGAWYIIENKVRENSMRYVFGMTDYSKAFKNASRYKYYLLNEALDAVRS